MAHHIPETQTRQLGFFKPPLQNVLTFKWWVVDLILIVKHNCILGCHNHYLFENHKKVKVEKSLKLAPNLVSTLLPPHTHQANEIDYLQNNKNEPHYYKRHKIFVLEVL